MNMSLEELVKMYESVGSTMAAYKEILCAMDARLGDGDLGITMCKGFAALPELIRDQNEADLGKRIFKAGVKMAALVPSTMGTLMASGIMAGGKKWMGKGEVGSRELADYLCGFEEGIAKRGKCQRGDRTVLDSIGPAADMAASCLERNPEATLEEVILSAYEGALQGVENSKNMVARFGKAAVHGEHCLGIEDQGACAGCYMIEGMKSYIINR